jgi:hypothetical protein
MKTYKALQAAGLPIPPDLKAEVEAALNPGSQTPVAPPGGGMPQLPGGPPGGPGGPGGPAGGPGEKIVMPSPPAGLGPTGTGTGAPGPSTPAIAPNGQGIGNGFAPPASFERRPGMPRATAHDKDGNWYDEQSQGDRDLAEEFNSAGDFRIGEKWFDGGDGDLIPSEKESSNIEDQSDTVSPLHTREAHEDHVVHRLPQAKNKKSYSIIDDPDILEQSESDAESESTR